MSKGECDLDGRSGGAGIPFRPGRGSTDPMVRNNLTGCSAAWLARLTGGQKVGGSNPLTPIAETPAGSPAGVSFALTIRLQQRTVRRPPRPSRAMAPGAGTMVRKTSIWPKPCEPRKVTTPPAERQIHEVRGIGGGIGRSGLVTRGVRAGPVLLPGMAGPASGSGRSGGTAPSFTVPQREFTQRSHPVHRGRACCTGCLRPPTRFGADPARRRDGSGHDQEDRPMTEKKT